MISKDQTKRYKEKGVFPKGEGEDNELEMIIEDKYLSDKDKSKNKDTE